MNYELTLGVPAIAVGLSAISLLAPTLPRSRSLSLSKRRSLRQAQCPSPAPRSRFRIPLAKDAAPIPNALAAAIIKTLLSNLIRTWYGDGTKDVHTD